MIALRPIAAGDAGARAGSGTKPEIEAEELREDELYRLQADRAESNASGSGLHQGRYKAHVEDEGHSARHEGETPSFPGGSAPSWPSSSLPTSRPKNPRTPSAMRQKPMIASARGGTLGWLSTCATLSTSPSSRR